MSKLIELNREKRKIIGLTGMAVFGFLFFNYLSIFPIQSLNLFVPWWVYVVLPYIIALFLIRSIFLACD